MIVIGDEILSGRTQDVNISHIARELGKAGVNFCEARIVPDHPDVIVETVNELRDMYDHVFTSGGIGPTHDDITTDAIASAFGVEVVFDPVAKALIAKQTAKYGLDLNDARMRMARVPEGATLIMNSVSGAPGYTIGNVNVMAGVPAIFRDMLETRLSELPTGKQNSSVTIDIGLPEGTIATKLARIAGIYPSVSIGSYPYYNTKGFGSQVVVRGLDLREVESASTDIEKAFGNNANRIK